MLRTMETGNASARCSRRIFPLIVFILNILVVLSGTALLILGGIIEEQISHHSEYIVNIKRLRGPVIILMVGGGFTIFCSLIGCYGAISANRSILNLYASVLLLAASLQLAGSIISFVRNGDNPDWDQRLQEEMRKFFLLYPVHPSDASHDSVAAKSYWDSTQKTFSCCGIRSRLDWSVHKPNLLKLPESCKCESFRINGIDVSCAVGGFYSNGCYGKVLENLNCIYNLQGALAWTAIGLAVLEVLFGVASIVFVNSDLGKQLLSQ